MKKKIKQIVLNKLILLLIMIFAASNIQAQQRHTFKIDNGSFVYDGKPIQIHSGEMHFARIPEAYWRQRLKMIKAMGLNAVATYVFWNYQEPEPGVWDFTTGNHNIRKFIKLAQEEGLFVILRPGPYACAEWEFGGFPWWLQKNKDLVLRTDNQPFLDSAKVYIDSLVNEVKDLQITQGGPVIMVQVENEFGSYVAQRKDIPMATHKKYINTIKSDLLSAGIDVPLFTADGSWLFKGGSVEGALPAANGEDNIANLKKVVDQYHHGEGPYMIGEFYPGWLDHWAEPFPTVPADKVVSQMKKYLDSSVSFNFYVVEGGTNFGFTSGANYSKKHDIQPDMTSYDYDAPINEPGWETPKYDSLRNVLIKYDHDKVPAVPKPFPVIAIPSIKLTQAEDLLNMKNNMTPVINDQPLTFEDLNQGYGYVLYSKIFKNAESGKLDISGLRDYALIYINRKQVGELNRYYNNYSCNINIASGDTLDILVENMGRINYGPEIIHNLKGIISPVKINDQEITGDWKMYHFPFSNMPDLKNANNSVVNNPTIYQGTFRLSKIGDTFLDMRNWGKGIVFVNGYNLGRYWNVGPQQTLYLPGCWLKKGENKIVVFEQQNNKIHQEISAIKKPILSQLEKSL